MLTAIVIWIAALIGFGAGATFKAAVDRHARRRREIDWDEASEEWF